MSTDVQKWLAEAGFESLAQAFTDNDIDWDMLPELTNEDLKDLGISRLGERKRVLAAIALLPHAAEVRSATEHEGPITPVQSAAAQHFSTPKVEAEFRQLTVMICDLVGSTELSRRVDAEELRIIISRFQSACVEAVEPLGGFVARFMGDGVLVYFGYPKADENDAERAVAAGLAVVEACTKFKANSVRVGIATGRVIVGDLLGSGPATERTVVGETPNLAARLQSVAQPNSVVVSETTMQLAGGGFSFKDLGQHSFKGFDDSVIAWSVSGLRAIESRFESSRGATLNPLVGRKTELMLLLDRWQSACDGEGQAVFISGEAGIGKSRLIEALRHEVTGGKHSVMRYQCSPHHITSAFYPVIVQVQRLARVEPEDSPDTKLDKLEALLEKAGNRNMADAQIYAHLLSIPFEHRYGALTQSPQEIKSQTLEILTNQVLALSERSPVMFLIEDTHWIDPASEEFLELVIGRVQSSMVLLVVTHRPAWQPGLLGFNNISSLQLNRLGRANCAAIVRAVAGEFVTDDVVQRIVSRTDGIPLFIEELTKSLVEGGLDIAEADIPATLQASLLSRIDRLGAQAKEIIQLCAVIGRETPLELLDSVAQKPRSTIEEGLKQLIQSELLFQSGTTSNIRYSFKHALVQDSVYDSMLSEVRKEHHLTIANSLVGKFPQTVDAAPELVAWHFTEAKSNDEAISYWHRAGTRSAGRSADAESVAQLQRAVVILDSIEETPERLHKKLALHVDLTGPLIAVGGYSSQNMEENTRRAFELAEKVGETDRIFPILYGRYVFHLHTGYVEKACELASEFLQLAEKNSERETIVQGHRLLGLALLIAGRPDAADTHLQEIADYKSPESGGSMPFVYGQDIEAAAKVQAGWARLHCGYPDQAVALFDQALSRAKTLNHANTLGVVLFHGCNMFYSMRLESRVQQCLSELDLLNEKYDLSLWRVAESIVRPGLLSLRGDYEQVIESVGPALSTYTEVLRMNMHTPFMLAQVADANLELSQAEDAIAVVNRALSVSETTGVQIEDPEIMRILAKAIHHKEGCGAAADNAYRSAMQRADAMNMRWYKLRIATDYAKYLAANGCGKEGEGILRPLVDSFGEGVELPDMVDAIDVLGAIDSG